MPEIAILLLLLTHLGCYLAGRQDGQVKLSREHTQRLERLNDA